MGVSFLVALRVTELASAPLRRAAEAGNLMADAADRLSVQARAANGALVAFATAADAVGAVMATSAAGLEDKLARLATATETTTTTMNTALANAEKAAREFSTQYSASAEEVLAAQFRLATAGIPVTEQIEATQGAFKFARATMGDFTQAAELLGSFLNTFGKSIELNYLAPAEKVAKITDVMSAAVQKYQIDMESLNDSLKFLVGPASTLGLSITETAAFAGALNTAGFRGTLAGTAISNAFNKIDNAIEKLELDPSQFTDATGNLKDFASFLDEVERKTANLTSIEKQSKFIEVFDIRAGRAIGTLIQMKEGVKQFAVEMDIASQVTQNMADTVEKTTSSKFKQFLNTIQNIGTTIGGELNESIKVLLDGMKAAAIAVGEFAEKNKVVIGAVIGIGGIVLTASAALVSYGLIAGRVSHALATLAQSGTIVATAVSAIQVGVGFAKLLVAVAAMSAVWELLAISVQKIAMVFDSSASTSDRMWSAVIGLTAGVAALIIGFIAVNSVIGMFTTIVTAATARIAAMAAGTGVLAATMRGLGVAVGYAFGPIGIAIAAIAGGAYLVAKVSEAITDGLSRAAAAGNKFGLSMREIDNQFGSSLTKAARYAAELDRLAKISEKNIAVTLKPEQQLGRLPVSLAASKDMRSNPTKDAARAIDEATKAAGGFDGVLTQVAHSIGRGSQATLAYADAYRKLRIETDPTFASLKDIGQAAETTKAMVGASELAIAALGDGTAQSVEALKKLLDIFNKLGNASFRNPADRIDVTKQAFEAIQTSMVALLKSPSEEVQNLAKEFENAQRASEGFNATTYEFFNLINGANSALGRVASRFESISHPALLLRGIMQGTEESVNRVKTATTAIANRFKNAKLGGESFANAVRESEEGIKQAERSLAAFQRLLDEAQKRKEFFVDNKLTNTQDFKDLEKLLERSLEVTVDLKARIDEQQATIALNKFSKFLDPTTNKQLIEARENLGNAFKSVIGDSLTGKIAQGDIFGSLANAFKQQFVDRIQNNIALAIGDKFKGEFLNAIVAAQQVIDQAALGGKMFEDLQSGSLAEQINNAVQAVAPQLKKLGLGNIFDLNDNEKLTKTFNDVFTDASVKMVTATSSTAAALLELQDIINRGPGKGQELIEQATRLQQLLTRASNTGAADAIRPIEEALSGVLAQLRQQGPTGPAQQLTAATQQVEGAVNNAVGRFAGMLTGIVPAAQSFISIIEEGFKRIKENGIGQLAESVIGDKSGQRSLNVKIENGTREINVTIDGSSRGTGELDEVEIRRIVDEARTSLKNEMDDSLRRLEDRLRGR